MPKRKKHIQGQALEKGGRRARPVLLAVAAAALAALVTVGLVLKPSGKASSPTASKTDARSSSQPEMTPAPAPGAGSGAPAELYRMDVAQAVMVTVELDFGLKVPSIAEALKEVERRYKPDDGVGRTFAILDAYGEPTPDGKLHMSMHVSSEKPGTGSLIFKRTGEVLWQSRITGARPVEPPAEKRLAILIDNGGRSITVDGSNNPPSVLEANAKELGVPVQSVWVDGQELEVTFAYSACGCPVKAMVKRIGSRTARTSDSPVMFPDDPAAMATISRLMRW